MKEWDREGVGGGRQTGCSHCYITHPTGQGSEFTLIKDGL